MNELYNLHPARDTRNLARSCFVRSVLAVVVGYGQLFTLLVEEILAYYIQGNHR